MVVSISSFFACISTQESNWKIIAAGAGLLSTPHLIRAAIQTCTSNYTSFFNNSWNITHIKTDLAIGGGLCLLGAVWWYNDKFYQYFSRNISNSGGLNYNKAQKNKLHKTELPKAAIKQATDSSRFDFNKSQDQDIESKKKRQQLDAKALQQAARNQSHNEIIIKDSLENELKQQCAQEIFKPKNAIQIAKVFHTPTGSFIVQQHEKCGDCTAFFILNSKGESVSARLPWQIREGFVIDSESKHAVGRTTGGIRKIIKFEQLAEYYSGLHTQRTDGFPFIILGSLNALKKLFVLHGKLNESDGEYNDDNIYVCDNDFSLAIKERENYKESLTLLSGEDEKYVLNTFQINKTANRVSYVHDKNHIKVLDISSDKAKSLLNDVIAFEKNSSSSLTKLTKIILSPSGSYVIYTPQNSKEYVIKCLETGSTLSLCSAMDDNFDAVFNKDESIVYFVQDNGVKSFSLKFEKVLENDVFTLNERKIRSMSYDEYTEKLFIVCSGITTSDQETYPKYIYEKNLNN